MSIISQNPDMAVPQLNQNQEQWLMSGSSVDSTADSEDNVGVDLVVLDDDHDGPHSSEQDEMEGTNSNELNCEICQNHFSSEALLKLHQKREHNINLGSGITSGDANEMDSNLYKCNICDKIFLHRQRLKVHMNKHMGIKPFACPMCPANFNTLASFQRHRRCHKSSSSNVPKHACYICNAQFSDIQHLGAHLKIHAENNQTCPECGIHVGGFHSLQNHLRTVHALIINNPWPSPKETSPVQASQGDTTRTKKMAATPVHTGSGPVSCRLCGRKFPSMRALQGHMKGHSRLYQWNPRTCKCGILLADEAEYQRHLRNYCSGKGSSIANHVLLPPMQSLTADASLVPSNVTSHTSPLPAQTKTHLTRMELDNVATFVPNQQSNASVEGNISRSTNPSALPLTKSPIPVSISVASEETMEYSEANSSQVSATASEPKQSKDSQDFNKCGKESSMGNTSIHEQEVGSPVGGITIKTEGWEEMVEIVQVRSSLAKRQRSDVSDNSERFVEREIQGMVHVGDEGAGCRGNGEIMKAGEGLSEDKSNWNIGQIPGEGHHHDRHNSKCQTRAEATSSNQAQQLDTDDEQSTNEPRISPRGSVPNQSNMNRESCRNMSSYDRTNSESPNTQITSSQSIYSTSNSAQNQDSNLGDGCEEVTRGRAQLPWRCSHCCVTFDDSLMYVIHKGCHEPGAPFRCSMCGEQCADKVTFMLHFVRGQHTKPTHI